MTPDGKFIIVSGKLDTHTSVYSFEKIQAAIKAGKFESKDPYGIPVIGMTDALDKQVQLGLGPAHPVRFQALSRLHLLYVDSQVAKWNYCEGKVLDKISVHYNIGHLMAMEGDSADPKGRYLVALNKLAIDRFVPVGPLHPQNHQLIDIQRQDAAALRHAAAAGRAALCRVDRAEKLKPGVRYKVGTDSRTDKPHPGAVRAGEEKRHRQEGQQDQVYGTLIRSHITRKHRSRCRRRSHHPPDQPRTGPGRDPRLHRLDLQRSWLHRAGQDRHRQVQGRQGRRLSVLLHGILLRRCT